MTSPEKKLARQTYIFDVLDKFTKTEPRLTTKEVAIVLADFFGEELTTLLKELRKENKK